MRVQKKFTQKGVTQQSFKNECDINHIVKRFSQTGQLPQSTRTIRYGVSEGDFQDVNFSIAEANSTFETLKPETKEKYGNVQNVLAVINDPLLAPELHEDGVFNAFNIPYKVPTKDTPESPPIADKEADLSRSDMSVENPQPADEISA